MNTNKIRSVSEEMDILYGKVGTPEREAFRHEAYSWYMGQMIYDARKSEISQITTPLSFPTTP